MIKKILFTIFFVGLYTTAFSQACGVGGGPGPDCANAAPLNLIPGSTISTGLQSNAGMGNNYPVNTSAMCGVSGLFGGALDGVYTIDVIIEGDYTFAFANNGSQFKSFAVHSACPIDNTNCVVGAHTFARDVSRTTYLTAGTYYILIDSFVGQTPVADFELLITTPSDNDACAGAIPLLSTIECNYVTYSNAGATDSGELPAPGCANYLGGDVWFSYEVNSTGAFTIDLDDDVITDSGMAVYTGTCGSLSLLDCDDDGSANGLMSSITLTGRTPGEIVYIRVWEYGNNNNGDFDICITAPLPSGTQGVSLGCPGDTELELTTDMSLICGGTTSLGSSIAGNLNGAATAPRPFSSANSTFCSMSGNNRRYEEIDFTVTSTGVYVFEAVASSFDSMGYIVLNDGNFTPGSCTPGTFIIGDDDSGATGNLAQLTVTLTAGTPYTLITTEYYVETGDSPYSWNVSSSTVDAEWYTAAVGGFNIGDGNSFNPVGVTNSGLPNTNTPGIYSFWAECPTNPGVRERADYVIGKVWDGDTDTNWNNPLNWTEDSVPTSSQCVFIPAGTPNDPIIPDNIDADGFNITVEDGATLTLTSDLDDNGLASSLTILDFVSVQGTAVLTVEDSANLVQVYDSSTAIKPTSANCGEIVVNRNTDISKLDYVYWSSPVENYDVSTIYGANTPTNYMFDWTQTIPVGTMPGVMPTGGMPICYGNWAPYSAGNMSAGKGYAVRGPNNLGSTVSTITVTFDGTANNGVITQPIVSGDNNITNNDYNLGSLTVTPLDDNWNLIGNPYPSALNANAFLTHPSNSIIEGAVHIWTHASDIGTFGDSFYEDFVFNYNNSDYITYNISGSSYPNETFAGQIASGQGFFVLALNDNESGSVTFNNSMRSSTFSNTDFYRTSSSSNITDINSIERNRIWLNLISSNGASSSIMVGYISGATQEKDRLYDAYTRETSELNIYSKIGNERMIIQGRALPFDDNDQVPLGTVIPQAGEYTIAISNVDGLFLDESQNIYLEDTHTGTIHNLRATPYTFTATERADYEDRFFLRYSDDALNLTDLELGGLRIIAPKGSYIKINSDRSPIDSVNVYDLLGRTLITETGINSSEFVITNTNLPSGAYIVKVTLNSGLSKTQKVILKQ